MTGEYGNGCARCGAQPFSLTMSRFNTEMICYPCDQDEREAPDYESARLLEDAAVQRGDYNYEGIGLSPQTRAFLMERIAARERSA